jgi:hypothetical protein
MMKRWVIVFLLAMPLRAVEMSPATAQDIYDAMGRDAIGLQLSPEMLPDLFTLTAGGIDQDATQMTVEQKYISGPWKGGKAVIEFSRDLSYTRVTVYDKLGQRQRLYSVRARSVAMTDDHRAAPVVRSSTTESGMPARFTWSEKKQAYIPIAAAPVSTETALVSSTPPPPSDEITLETPASMARPAGPPKPSALELSSVPIVGASVPTTDDLLRTDDADYAAQQKLAAALANGNSPPSSERLIPVPLDHDILRMRAEENRLAVERTAAKAKKEEFWLSTFEKFQGPAYGNHREYERRFVPGKNRFSKAPDHDFYIDEVDHRKGIHNIYYYVHQTGMAPKLIALERHQKVSFRENYDIAKEDKGEIKLYH